MKRGDAAEECASTGATECDEMSVDGGITEITRREVMFGDDGITAAEKRRVWQIEGLLKLAKSAPEEGDVDEWECYINRIHELELERSHEWAVKCPMTDKTLGDSGTEEALVDSSGNNNMDETPVKGVTDEVLKDSGIIVKANVARAVDSA